jgi:hypothetical protein
VSLSAATSRAPRWPEQQSQPPELFAGRPAFRQMRVLLDVDSIGEPPSDQGHVGLLLGLLSHEYINLLRYSDSGPPADAPRRQLQWGGSAPIGWAELGLRDAATDTRSVTYSDGDSVTHAGIMGNAHVVAASDTASSAYSGLVEIEQRSRRVSDVLAAQVADATGADILISSRPYLYQMTWRATPDVTILTPEEALSVIGLYLRAQGQFPVWRNRDGLGSITFNRGLFYWVGTRALLPEGWRWFSACAQHSHVPGNNDELLYLGQSVLERVERALRERDSLNISLNRRQSNDTADDTLAALDALTLWLMGAMDATARVAHKICVGDGEERLAGWQHDKWRKKIEKHSPKLSQLVVPGTDGWHIVNVLRLLRNTVHSSALSPLGVSSLGRREGTLVRLPREDTASLKHSVNALGGKLLWGVQSVLPSDIHADPGLLAEQIVVRVIALLNQLMQATPVEQLPGVSLKPEDLLPPADSSGAPGAFDEFNRRSVLWQLGLA